MTVLLFLLTLFLTCSTFSDVIRILYFDLSQSFMEKQLSSPPDIHQTERTAVFISFTYYFLYPVVKSTTFRYGVPFAQADRFAPAIFTILSNVSAR